ncbi:MAG: hypothetical protein ABH864_02925 [archaeon]
MNFTKKETALVVSVILFSLLIPITSAELLVGQTESLYNLGDDFEITLTLNPTTPASDFLKASLICGENEVEIYKSPQSVSPGEEKSVTLSARLDTFLVQGTEGECYIKASFGTEETNSQKFEVTDDVSVMLNIEGIIFGPGERVAVHGRSEKANGKPLNGFVEVSVAGIDFSFTGPVKNGNFNLTFKVPDNAPSGSYEILARAYEKDLSSKIINEGETSAAIRIKQVIRSIDIALSDQSVSPKEEFTYSIILYDQSGKHAEGEASVKVYKPEGALFDQKIVRADQSIKVPLLQNSPPGYWKIETKYGDLETSKQFLLEELKDLSFTLSENTLVLENSGNIPFTGPVEVSIGGTNELKDIKDLQVGASLAYELKAPNGEYTIEVGEGSDKENLGSTFLTGRAITVQAVGEGSGVLSTSLWVLGSLILLLVLALVAVYLYRKFFHKKLAPAMPGTVPQKKVDPLSASATAQKAKEQNQHLIDKGEKQESSIVSLKLKNSEEIGKHPESNKIIDSALWKAKEAGAKIYSDGDYRIMILAPVLTKDKENDMKALHVARSMERLLGTHNRRAANKIEFGLGVNTGTLIVESSGEKFRFMSLNNIIAATKRISESANSETLISEALRNKVIGKIKTTKLQGKNLWKIDRIIDRSAYSDHIKTLTKNPRFQPHGASRSFGHSNTPKKK